MATAAELISEVQDIIQDSSYTNAKTLSYLNRGMRQIAGGMNVYYPDGTRVFSSPLDLLATSGTVTTSTTLAYVALPVAYSRSLYFVSSAAVNTSIEIFQTFIEFLRYSPSLDRTGNVTQVAIKGSNLYYQGIPATADTLTLYYYGAPTDMDVDADEPDCLPTHLHEELLVNFAAWKIFDQIEDGIEGAKVNTLNYKGLFNDAMVALESETLGDLGPMQFLMDE